MFSRFNGNVEPFASDATGTNRTVFGDTVQSDDIDDNLNADFKSGWEIVGVNDNPTKQDFNALAFTISNLVAYLYQQGVAEWNTTQKYLANSYVTGSDGKLYRAKTGTTGTPNEGNDPTTDSTNWESLDSKFLSLSGGTLTGNLELQSLAVSNEIGVPSGSSLTDPTFTCVTDQDTGFNFDNNGGINFVSNGVLKFNLKNLIDLTIANSYDLGVGQTWQDVAASRSAGVTYTNTTGKPIIVSLRSAGITTITINGVSIGTWNGSAASTEFPAYFIVGDGDTYSSNRKDGYWYEYR